MIIWKGLSRIFPPIDSAEQTQRAVNEVIELGVSIQLTQTVPDSTLQRPVVDSSGSATPSPDSLETPAPHVLEVIPYDDGMVQVKIDGQIFPMGLNEPGSNAYPVHQVPLSQYYIDLTEVTNNMYVEFLNQNGNQDKIIEIRYYIRNHPLSRISKTIATGEWTVQDGYGEHPVNNVTWYGANAYCDWVGRRLPSEAEWEFAARGGLDGKIYPWGNDIPICNTGAPNGAQFKDCLDDTVMVKSFFPNGYGLYGISGNVWEWVADYYDEYPGGTPNQEGMGQINKVLRGGSWMDTHDYQTVYRREWENPMDESADNLYVFGFRCARDIKMTEE